MLHGDVRPGEEIERTGVVVADIALRHDTAVSRVFVSAEHYREESTPFLRNVLGEGITV